MTLSPSKISFGDLPSEIVHRILELGTFSNTLTLSLVCRKTRDATRSIRVYCEIIREAHDEEHIDIPGYTPMRGRSSAHECNDLVGLGTSQDWVKVARWARAEELLRTLNHGLLRRTEKQDGDEVETSQDHDLEGGEASGSQAKSRPASSSPSSEKARIPPNDEPKFNARLLLCLPQFAILAHPLMFEVYTDGEDILQEAIGHADESNNLKLKWLTSLIVTAKSMKRPPPEDHIVQNAELLGHDYADPLRLHAHMNLSIARLYINLKIRRYAGGESPGDIATPLLEQFPLWQLCGLDDPFHDIDSSNILPHVKNMCTAEFLTSGEWIGYYDYSLAIQPHQHEIDPMMHSIKFEVGTIRDGMLPVRARDCRDARGTFDLAGEIDPQSGIASITKQYRGGLAWPWRPVMTPFGLVSSWGHPTWGGWVWLWKKEWSETPPKRGRCYFYRSKRQRRKDNACCVHDHIGGECPSVTPSSPPPRSY
ncbi:Hypothetical protein D9617_3g018140 [Elsinoe fawcettii]|nr:Hypothetical protein D9617_3g018140 [Elsinoe fawcettii]